MKNILGAKENKCEFCNGIEYKLKTKLDTLYQCSNCGNLHK